MAKKKAQPRRRHQKSKSQAKEKVRKPSPNTKERHDAGQEECTQEINKKKQKKQKQIKAKEKARKPHQPHIFYFSKPKRRQLFVS